MAWYNYLGVRTQATHDPLGNKRSPHWASVRKAHLVKEPACRVCGSKQGVQVHHKRPFHLHPELELEPANLISLCENKSHDHHLLFGHLGNFQSYNPAVEFDANQWREKIAHRPTGQEASAA